MAAHRGEWSSKLGFVFAAAGSAIGLGNIWRFPYIVGENGGAAFVFVYVFFVIAIGLPYMFAELALGRSVQRNPVGAIEAIKPGSAWKAVGYLGVITGLGILSFYGVIAGWTVGYIYKMFVGNPGNFGQFIGDPLTVIPLFAFFIIITALIVHGGVSGGIEKWSKILMPIFFILLVGLIVYSVTLDGAEKGLSFYLMPDFSKISGKTILAALGQAFFSLSLGMGLMITYGSYVSKKENLVTSAVYIALFDTLIAIMAGLVIFPALFAMGKSPEAGPTLVFVVLPELFLQMPGGLIVGALFFILLSVAALTSTISLLEVPVAYVVDEMKMSRKTVVWIVAFVAFLLGLPSALSQGASAYWSHFGWIPKRLASQDFLSQMSFIFGDFSLAFGAFVLSIFIGWVWGAKYAADEIETGSSAFSKGRQLWIFMIRYFIPVIIFLILLNLFGIF
ncbi:MAG TPA: sodium-dependent transporter [Caldithrix abyssi]|uniref:Transporter n=1 Tax=Caldithrix abyssi TaxID=187145 RepID=A0A7V4U0E7_CALAY|nr:sodium-dependent transporter [Caldithrix abyssi]